MTITVSFIILDLKLLESGLEKTSEGISMILNLINEVMSEIVTQDVTVPDLPDQCQVLPKLLPNVVDEQFNIGLPMEETKILAKEEDPTAQY